MNIQTSTRPAMQDGGRREVDIRAYRNLLGRFATGVALVAVRLPDGEIAAMTVNSFVSVSLEPPIVAFCVMNGSQTWESIAEQRRFTISFLGAPGRDASTFYAKRQERGDHHPEHWDNTGGHPVSIATVGWVACELREAIPVGDHLLVLGDVQEWSEGSGSDPLIFFEGKYHNVEGR